MVHMLSIATLRFVWFPLLAHCNRTAGAVLGAHVLVLEAGGHEAVQRESVGPDLCPRRVLCETVAQNTRHV